MKKVILTWILILTVVLGTGLPVFNLTAHADQGESLSSESTDNEEDSSIKVLEDSRFNIKIKYGFNGQFRLGAAIPVTVSMEAVKADYNGILRVIIPGNTDYSTEPVSYEKEISLKQGVQKNITISVYDLSYITGIELQLEDSKGKITVDKVVSVSSNTGTQALVGVLCDEYSSLSYLDHCNINAGDYMGSSALVELNQASFPEQKSGLEALSYLIVDNYSSSQLNELQVEAIKGWVASGGVLILGGGKNCPRTLAAFDEDLINYTQGKTMEGTLSLKGDGKYVTSEEETSTSDIDTVSEEDSSNNGENLTTDGSASDNAATAEGGDVTDNNAAAEGGDVTDNNVSAEGGDVTDNNAAADSGDTTDQAAVSDGTEGADSQNPDQTTLGGDVSDVEQTETSYIEIDETPYAFTKKDGVYKIKLKNGETLSDIFKDDELVWNQDYEKGRIILTAFDLSSALIGDWDGKDDFATVLFSESAEGYSAERIQNLNFYNYSDHNEESTALYHMINIGTPDMKKIGIILGVFAVLVGLIYYIFLKIIDKRSLLWILVPVTALVCSGAVLYVTGGIRIRHPLTASMTEYYYDSDQKNGETTVDLLTVVPGTEENKITLNENLYGIQVYNFSTTSSLIFMPSYSTTDSENYDANIALSENEDGYDVSINNDRTFESSFFHMKTDQENEAAGLSLQAERSLDGISGTVKNNTDYDIECVSVYVKEAEVAIGTLKSGEEASFTLAENKEKDPEFAQLNMPGAEMGTAMYDQMERIWNIFYERYLSDMDVMDVYTFGYIGDVKENYISTKKISEENSGMIICHNSMGYKEYEGCELYDMYSFIGDHENGFTDDGTQLLNAVETQCTFVLPLTEVRYLVRNDITQAGASSDNIKVYAFNGQTGEYDELFKKDSRMAFKNGCPYVADDGSILIKFVCTEPGYECAPDLTVAGGEN